MSKSGVNSEQTLLCVQGDCSWPLLVFPSCSPAASFTSPSLLMPLVSPFAFRSPRAWDLFVHTAAGSCAGVIYVWSKVNSLAMCPS